MPRAPRIDLPGLAQHVVQRGNDRQACFFGEGDYLRYLRCLQESSLKHGCRIHAYVLMTNHVHLLVTPVRIGAVASMMQSVGREYVRYVNDSAGRSGTLWEGRYKSSLVDDEHYLLACYRYIELNPVRAGLCADAIEYRWSSHGANAAGASDPLVHPHDTFLRLGASVEERMAVYRALFAQAIPDEQMAAIRLYVQRQRALGPEKFQLQIEAMLGRRAGIGQPGRPRRAPDH